MDCLMLIWREDDGRGSAGVTGENNGIHCMHLCVQGSGEHAKKKREEFSFSKPHTKTHTGTPWPSISVQASEFEREK